MLKHVLFSEFFFFEHSIFYLLQDDYIHLSNVSLCDCNSFSLGCVQSSQQRHPTKVFSPSFHYEIHMGVLQKLGYIPLIALLSSFNEDQSFGYYMIPNAVVFLLYEETQFWWVQKHLKPKTPWMTMGDHPILCGPQVMTGSHQVCVTTATEYVALPSRQARICVDHNGSKWPYFGHILHLYLI